MSSETLALLKDYPHLEWLPDESLFSLCSRHHQIWGHAFASRSTVLMFGKDRTGTHHDFPNGLATFSQRTQHVFGDAESLARKKTLLRFFSPFTPRAEVEQAVLGMTGGSVAHLKY